MNLATNSLRGRNMQKRRTRLLSEARNLLARGGFEALNLRELAKRAEITVPTIYNLIGKKEDLLLLLASDVVGEIEARIIPTPDTAPLDLAAAVVVESTPLFAENEEFYRSAFLAVEWLDQTGQHHAEVARIYAWAGSLMKSGIDACREAGLVNGKIDSRLLSELVTRNYRINCRGWAFGHYDISEFRRIALSDLYTTLAADAVDTFHAQLVQIINDLSAESANRADTQNAHGKKRGEAA